MIRNPKAPPLTTELRGHHEDALHVAAVKITNAIEDRDQAICDAALDGMPITHIAAAVELTRQRVHQILRAER